MRLDDERQLIERMKGGDMQALQPLVLRYEDKAIRSAYLITQDAQLAKDVAQEAFIRAYQRIDQFDSSRPFAPWFFTIVANMALKLVTKNKRIISLNQLPTDTAWLKDLANNPEQAMEATDLRERLQALLNDLSPEKRAVIVLRYYLGYSESEIANELDTPVGTVKSRLHAARQQLRRLFSQQQSMSVYGGEV